MSDIADEALTFVEVEEDSSKQYYEKHYTHFDWPLGASGPTIAIGYDCGYVTEAEIDADWTGIIDPARIAVIKSACGLKGSLAHTFVINHGKSITISWDEAVQEFVTREVPKWIKRIEAVLPNYDLLNPLCKGAIFSLSYNRGCGGYDDPSARDYEMRQIKQAMIAKNFKVIGGLIRSMKRIWPPVGSDLWNRRIHEGDLFDKGMAQIVSPPAATPTS